MKTETYEQMKTRHQKEIDVFPFGCAFNEWQYKVMMEGLGLDPETDKDKIARVFSGTFVKKSDLGAFREMMNRHDAELKAAFTADKTGEGFIYDAIKYELANHEYYYSGDLDTVLAVLSISQSDVEQNENIKRALEKAELDYMCEMSRREDEMFDPLAK